MPAGICHKIRSLSRRSGSIFLASLEKMSSFPGLTRFANFGRRSGKSGPFREGRGV
jgi:hypothetical protein